MMTKEEYYAQIKEMYAQKYESKDKKIEAADRRFREYLMRRNDDDDETDWWYRSEKENPEDQVLNDEELVETEVATELIGIEDGPVKREANLEEESNPQFQMMTVADSTCVQHTNVISQQVSISPLEYSLNFCKANLDVMGNCQYAMGKTHQIWSDSNFGCVNDDACQVFAVIPVRTKVLPKEHKKRFHKSWRFKFKQRVATRESKSGFEVNMKHNQSKEMLLQFLLSVTHKKRQRKTPKHHKTWKFRFKNMELQRIMTQLDTQHFIFRWDKQPLLWMQNNAEPILIVSELEREKKKLCYKTWMFKYKAPHLDTKVFETSDQSTRKRVFVGADRLTKNNQPTLRSLMNVKQSYPSLRANRVWDPGGSLVDAATP